MYGHVEPACQISKKKKNRVKRATTQSHNNSSIYFGVNLESLLLIRRSFWQYATTLISTPQRSNKRDSICEIGLRQLPAALAGI